MSDYEVGLVNDNMQEFHVKFNGPEDSIYFYFIISPFYRWSVEDPCRVTRTISI